MAQPLDRGATHPALGPLQTDLKQFWLPNPSQFPGGKHNLSAYERNRVFLNSAAGRFHDVSFLCGADSDGDGRAAVAGDFNEDGRMDLVVRQVSGGPLLVFENHFPQQNWLAVSLHGRRSNSCGIGARLELTAAGQRQVREMYPVNSFKSRAACVVHFGLGPATRVDRLTVRWPSGTIQEFSGLDANRHVVLTEGAASVATAALRQPGLD